MVCAVALDSQRHAGEHGPFVHDHGTGAAGAPVAEHLGPGQAQPVMDQRIEGYVWLNLEFVVLAVDGEGDAVLRAGARAPRHARRRYGP